MAYRVARAAASAMGAGVCVRYSVCDAVCCPDGSASIFFVDDVIIRTSFTQERDPMHFENQIIVELVRR